MTLDRTLFACAAAHLFAGVVGLPLLRLGATMHEHPAAKPLRFAFSIALFLGSLAVLLPLLTLERPWKDALAKVLAATMSAEMLLITVQALRGRTSHFNVDTPLDAAIWRCMVAAIVAASAAMLSIAVIASTRPLRDAQGLLVDPLMAASWRVALWCFFVVALTGFRMGGAGRHSVGGPDGGDGMAVSGWSVEHGDLRVPHFMALHALQVLPLFAATLLEVPIGSGARWVLLLVAMGAQAAVTIGALLQASAGRPAV